MILSQHREFVPSLLRMFLLLWDWGGALQQHYRLSQGANQQPPPPAAADPFVSVMLAVPRLLARRSSSDEPLQLHSVAYVATAAAYCRQRTDSGAPGWCANNTTGATKN